MFERFYRAPAASSFFLFGPRGTGKSTWLQQHYPEALFLDLIDPAQERYYSAAPERLRDTVAASPNRRPVVIDEVQRVPQLLQVVHQLIERDKALRFVLTGSSARKLRRTGVDLLAGRALLTTMHPLMAAEMANREGAPGHQADTPSHDPHRAPEHTSFHLDHALTLGMIPLVVDASDPQATLRTYAGMYVREEVQAEGLLRNVGAFYRFLEAASFSHGTVLNVSNLARECQVERKMATNYLSILEDLLLAFALPVFRRRARRQMTVHPKLYFVDPGLFRSLRPTGPFDSSAEMAGPALEGLIAQHLRAWVAYSGTSDTLYFWRTRSGSEVDFVLYGESGLFALEVKNSGAVHPRDLRGLKSFVEDYPEATAALLYRGPRALRRGVLCLRCESFLRRLRPGAPLEAALRETAG